MRSRRGDTAIGIDHERNLRDNAPLHVIRGCFNHPFRIRRCKGQGIRTAIAGIHQRERNRCGHAHASRVGTVLILFPIESSIAVGIEQIRGFIIAAGNQAIQVEPAFQGSVARNRIRPELDVGQGDREITVSIGIVNVIDRARPSLRHTDRGELIIGSKCAVVDQHQRASVRGVIAAQIKDQVIESGVKNA